MNTKKITELPRGLYRRKDSPFIWGKFKTEGMRKPFVFSTGTSDVKLAEISLNDKRNAAIKGKITGEHDRIGLKAMVGKALALMGKDSNYRTSVMNVVNFLVGDKSDTPAKDVTPADIEEYNQYRLKSASPSTVNRELGYVQSCYNTAIKKMRLTLEDPVKGFQRHDESVFARERYLTYEERVKLFGDKQLPQNMKDVYMWAMKTGMRQGEIRDMRWTDVNWVDKTVKVKTSKKKKRGAAGAAKTFRHVPLHLYCLEILKRRRAEGWDKRSQYVFCTEESPRRQQPVGSQLTADGQLTSALEYACVRHKIEDFNFHDFRHTFATDFLRAAHDLKAFKTLAEIMGHSVERMTARYAHLFPEDKINQINLLPNEPGWTTPAVSPETGKKNAQESYVQVTLAKSA